MRYGKVITVSTNKAQVLFENLNIQKEVKVAQHIENLEAGDTVTVLFETEMLNGIIVGVV